MTDSSPAALQHGTSRPEPDAASSATQLAGDEVGKTRTARREQVNLFRQVIKQTPDFPKPGILFEDIFPIFASPVHHEALLRAFELQIKEVLGSTKPDVIVGLDARGFLFGPNLALRLGSAFVPVRKEGKLPGKVITAKYEKEYGSDVFAMQVGAIQPGQTVVIVDDLVATGGSAAAAVELVNKASGNLVCAIFIIELGFLNGRSKINTPVYTLIESQS